MFTIAIASIELYEFNESKSKTPPALIIAGAVMDMIVGVGAFLFLKNIPLSSSWFGSFAQGFALGLGPSTAIVAPILATMLILLNSPEKYKKVVELTIN